MKINKEKSKKLEEKIDKLAEKLENKVEEIKNEKSSIKRMSYIINCKMLVKKIERQQELFKVMKGFEKEKEDRNFTAKEEKMARRSKIIEHKKTIKYIEKQLRKYRQYDFNSPDFMFSKKDVKNVGGINQYANELEESQEPEQIETAEKIRGIMEYRKLLEYTKGKLKEEQERIEELNWDLKDANNSVSRKEMFVTVKSKFNIFAKLSNLASSIRYGIKEFVEEAKENRDVDKRKANDFEGLQSAYEMKEEEIIRKYEQEMKNLHETYQEVAEEKYSIWNEYDKKRSSTKRKGQAAKFQEELKNMTTITGNEQIDEKNRAGEERQQEERGKIPEIKNQTKNREGAEGQSHDTGSETIEVWKGDVIDTPSSNDEMII